MTRDEAREHFKSLNLSYDQISEMDIYILVKFIETELEDYYKNGGEHAKKMDLRVRAPLKKYIKTTKRNGLEYAYLKVKGSYFESREAISFNKDGFIGFGGELDDKNVQPILKAFCNWCYSNVLINKMITHKISN